MASRKKQNSGDIIQDLGMIFLSVLIAIILVKTDILSHLLTQTQGLELLGSFIAGIFFTSIFTTAPAIVTLGQLAQSNNLWLVALFGAAGSVLGDLLIFRFVKDRLSEHLMQMIKSQKGKKTKKITMLLKARAFRWASFVVGGLIIASPLPDELGIGLIGFSKTKLSWFIPFSYAFNFIGILLIGLAAKAL